MKKIVLTAGVVFVICVLIFSRLGKTLWQAAFLLPSLAPDTTFHPLELITQPPHVEHVLIPTETGELVADVYVPTENTRGAILLVSGASILGKDDPRIINFGTALSRIGAAVIIPDFPDITAERFATTSVPEIVSAYMYTESRFPEGNNGMAAFSIATGPMFMAAADHNIAGEIGYLVSFGGYTDMKEIIRNATTATGRDPTETYEIRAIFKNHFGEDSSFEALLTNTDPAKFDELYKALRPNVKEFIEGVSPAPYLSSIKAPKVLLIHSDPDPDVPTGESVKLKNLLGDRAELVLLRSFSHTNIKFEAFSLKSFFTFYIPETWKLYRVAYEVLTF